MKISHKQITYLVENHIHKTNLEKLIIHVTKLRENLEEKERKRIFK